jgi:hypothetical protein
MMLTSAQYLAEMRRIERVRNEARSCGDKAAIHAILMRAADVNRVFWGARHP